jgi:Spy/CpxP family protein refolding chaperone
MGPGMMSDRDSRGYGPGYGPGGRDDYRMGPGMMGRGYGHQGMMGGHGMGMGMGMMGGPDFRAVHALDLTDEQRKQVFKIEDDLRKQQWSQMERMHDEMSRLRDAYWSDGKRDRDAILAASRKMSDLRQQMLVQGLDAEDRIDAVLTPQQRDQLRKQQWR